MKKHNNDASKKMVTRPVGSSNGQLQSPADHLISGWQGSDEDEEVNIDSEEEIVDTDSSDDEKERAPTSTRLSRSGTCPAESNPRVHDGREVGLGSTGRDTPRKSPRPETLWTDPEGSYEMKVKSSDARRFRKELTASKSAAKMPVVPRYSSNLPSMRGSLASEKRGRKSDAASEGVEERECSPRSSPVSLNRRSPLRQSMSQTTGDKSDKGLQESKAIDVEEGHRSPGNSPVLMNRRSSLKQSLSKRTADKSNKGLQDGELVQKKKKKGKDSKEISDSDKEECRKRRYRELEQAQRAADRKLSLRERPEPRQRDEGGRKETRDYPRRARQDVDYSPAFKMKSGSSPQAKRAKKETGSISPSVNDKRIYEIRAASRAIPLVNNNGETDSEEITNAESIQQTYKKAKRSDRQNPTDNDVDEVCNTPIKHRLAAKKPSTLLISDKGAEKKAGEPEGVNKLQGERPTGGTDKLLGDTSPPKQGIGLPELPKRTVLRDASIDVCSNNEISLALVGTDGIPAVVDTEFVDLTGTGDCNSNAEQQTAVKPDYFGPAKTMRQTSSSEISNVDKESYCTRSAEKGVFASSDGALPTESAGKDSDLFCRESLDHSSEKRRLGKQPAGEDESNSKSKEQVWEPSDYDNNLKTLGTTAVEIATDVIDESKREECTDNDQPKSNTVSEAAVTATNSVLDTTSSRGLPNTSVNVQITTSSTSTGTVSTPALTVVTGFETGSILQTQEWRQEIGGRQAVGSNEGDKENNADFDERCLRPNRKGNCDLSTETAEKLPAGESASDKTGSKNVLHPAKRRNSVHDEGLESDPFISLRNTSTSSKQTDRALKVGAEELVLEDKSNKSESSRRADNSVDLHKHPSDVTFSTMRTESNRIRREIQHMEGRLLPSSGEEEPEESVTFVRKIVGTDGKDGEAGARRFLDGYEAPQEDQSIDAHVECHSRSKDADDGYIDHPSDADDHNSFCEACSLGGQLLCCEGYGCRITYHLECADPAMTEVPKGKWYCPACTQRRLSFGVHASSRAVESIWDVRDYTADLYNVHPHSTDHQSKPGAADQSNPELNVSFDDQARTTTVVEETPSSTTSRPQRVTRRKVMELEDRRQPEKMKSDGHGKTDISKLTEAKSSLSAEPGTCPGKDSDKEYFVKWSNLSHLHNTWVPEIELRKLAPKALENFKKKLDLGQAPAWQPQWQVPQRFLSRRLNAPPRRPGGGRGRGYLGMDAGLEWYVKWQDLPYDQCTWEQVRSGILDCEISKKLESDYERWCEGARQRSHPARVEEVMKLRRASLKTLEEQPQWFQGCDLTARQLEELNLLRERWHQHHNTIFVDENDQERTTTAIAFLLSLIEEYGAYKPILVIVPYVALQFWETELRRCAGHVNTVVLTGWKNARVVVRRHELNPSEKPIKFQVVLTTYEAANIEHEHLKKFEWEALILDEAHRSKMFKTYCSLQFIAPYRLIVLNELSKCNVEELLHLLLYLEPENDTLESDLQKHLSELDEDTQIVFLKEKLVCKMVRISNSHETSRLEFTENWIAGHMTPTQVQLYCTELTKHYSLLHTGRMRTDQNSVTMHGLLSILKNVCNHPFLVDPTLQNELAINLKPSQTLVEAGVELCGKFRTLQLMVSYLHAKGRRVILLCQTDTLCYYIDDYMRQTFGADSYECVSKGSTTSKNQALQRFNAEDSTRFVFILKKNTTGVSCRLRETDDVIVYDSDWNPASDIQYLEKVIYKMRGELRIYRLYTPLSVEEASVVYLRQRKVEPQSGMKSITTKYCQQLVRWKAKELLNLDDRYQRRNRSSKKKPTPEISDGLSEQDVELVKKILDGSEAEAESLTEVMPEEDAESLKEFWCSMLKDRHADLQDEELTNAGKGLRNRKRVHYSEEALAQAPYAAANDEEVKRRKRKPQVLEQVQLGSPRSNSLHSPVKSSSATLVESLSADEIPASYITTKKVDNSDSASQKVPELVANIEAENANMVEAEVSRGSRCKITETQAPAQHKEDLVPMLPERTTTRSIGVVNPTASEEGRKTRSEQQQIMFGLWRQDVTQICKILEFPENIACYADQLLGYCMKSYRMPKEPKDLVLQVQIALCVVASERFHREIDHLTTLSRVEEAMDVKQKRESWKDNYQKFVSLCKDYPLPSVEPPSNLTTQAQQAAVDTDESSQSRPKEEEPSLQGAVNISENSDSCQQSQNNLPGAQIAESSDTVDRYQLDNSPSKEILAQISVSGDQIDVAEKEQDVQGTCAQEVPSTISTHTENGPATDEPHMQNVVVISGIEKEPGSTSGEVEVEQIVEKLKMEKHEVLSVVMYQQAKEMKEFFKVSDELREEYRTNDEHNRGCGSKSLDIATRTYVLRGQGENLSNSTRSFQSEYKKQHMLLVASQRSIRDEIHSVYNKLLKQAAEGLSSSLFAEVQGILAKIGVTSVEEAQSILLAAGDETRRKKTVTDLPTEPMEQVRNQVSRTAGQSQVQRLHEIAVPTQVMENVSLPQLASLGRSQPHLLVTRSREVSQPLPSQPPELSEPCPSPPAQVSQSRHPQLQQSATHPLPFTTLNQGRDLCQPLDHVQQTSSHLAVLPNEMSAETQQLQHPPLHRPSLTSREQTLPAQERSQPPSQHLYTSSHTVLVPDPVTSQGLHHTGRTQSVESSHPTQRTTQVRHTTPQQQRIIQVLQRVSSSSSANQQPLWHNSSTGQVLPPYTRVQGQHPQQQSSSQGHIVPSTGAAPATTQVSQPHVSTMFFPPIPANQLGPDPIAQEEVRLKKEREKIRIAYEQKSAELRMQQAREETEAKRNYEAILMNLRKKFDGLKDETQQSWDQQNFVLHQKLVKVHRSRLLAEALRTRCMFDAGYQTRNNVQQGDESASVGVQLRNTMTGATFACRPHLQATQESLLPLRRIAALNNEATVNSGSGPTVNAVQSSGRGAFHQSNVVPMRMVPPSNRELVLGSVQAGMVSSASPSGGITLGLTHLNTVMSNDAGQRAEIASGHSQSVNQSSSIAGRGRFSAGPVQLAAGRVAGPGVGLWQSNSPNNIGRPVDWQNHTLSGTATSSPCASMPSQTCPNIIVPGESHWNLAAAGSFILPESAPTVTSNVSSTRFDNISRAQQSPTPQETTLDSHLLHQRRSWSCEGTGNLTPQSTINGMESPQADGPLQRRSDVFASRRTNIVAAEAPTVVTEAVLVSVNPNVSTGTEPVAPTVGLSGNDLQQARNGNALSESCILGDWSSLVTPSPSPNAAPINSLGSPREAHLRRLVEVDGLADPPTIAISASSPSVPIIYLSDDD